MFVGCWFVVVVVVVVVVALSICIQENYGLLQI